MSLSDEPATERQLMLLRSSGFAPTGPLSVTEAARLIRECQKGVVTARPRQAGGSAARMTASRERVSGLSESAKAYAYRLHVGVETAQRAMAQSPDAPNVKADMASATAARLEFWIDTCQEVGQMHNASVQVLELYQSYGCRFSAPTRGQVQEIFEALDGALPLWEKEHPELFYQTLELNFPELVRQH